MEFKCYILYSRSRDRFYVGMTGSSMEERIQKHNSNHRGYTGKIGDWELVHSESFEHKTQALQREKEIKKWKSRKKIIDLVRHPN